MSGDTRLKYEGRIRTTWLDWVSLALVIIGALNWGLVGAGGFFMANWNVVSMIFGSIPLLESLIYVLVGLAGLYELYFAYQLYTARSAEMETPRKEEAA